MSLQNIINESVSLSIDKRKLAGQSISRSGKVKTSYVNTLRPWIFTVEVQPALDYESVRDFLEDIDTLDITGVEEVEIGVSNTGLSWLVAYRGNLTPTQIGQMGISSVSGNTFTVDVSGVVGGSSGDYVCRKGDFIQPDTGYKYPYKVTDDVLLGSGSTVAIPVHRPIITQSGYTFSGKDLVFGTDCTWNMKLTNKPNYTVVPGRFVQFDEPVVLMEVIED